MFGFYNKVGTCSTLSYSISNCLSEQNKLNTTSLKRHRPVHSNSLCFYLNLRWQCQSCCITFVSIYRSRGNYCDDETGTPEVWITVNIDHSWWMVIMTWDRNFFFTFGLLFCRTQARASTFVYTKWSVFKYRNDLIIMSGW
jgi:hypothetical protein